MAWSFVDLLRKMSDMRWGWGDAENDARQGHNEETQGPAQCSAVLRNSVTSVSIIEPQPCRYQRRAALLEKEKALFILETGYCDTWQLTGWWLMAHTFHLGSLAQIFNGRTFRYIDWCQKQTTRLRKFAEKGSGAPGDFVQSIIIMSCTAENVKVIPDRSD